MICEFIQTIDIDVVREALLSFEDFHPNRQRMFELFGRVHFPDRDPTLVFHLPSCMLLPRPNVVLSNASQSP